MKSIFIFLSLTLMSCYSYKPMINSNTPGSPENVELVDRLIPGKHYQLRLADGRKVNIKVTAVNTQWVVGEVNTKPYHLDSKLVREINVRKVSPLKITGLVVGMLGTFIGLVFLDIEQNGMGPLL